MMFLYSLTEPARVLICMISVFCVGFQTAAFVYTVVRSTFRDRKRTAAYISQTAVTAQSLVMLIIVARAQLNAWMFLPAGSEYEVMRYGVFAAVAASCIAVACVSRVYDVLLCAVVSSVSLPYIDLLPYKAAAVIFCAAEFLLIARAVLLMRVCRRDIKNELSRDSVKLALDELHSGLLFCEPDGNILLVNGRMQRLMQVLCGEVYRNGKKFYERLLSGDVSDSCSSNVIDGKTVFILPDGKVWFFTRCDIYIKNRRYVQLSAADVTEQWMLTNELNAQRAMLQSRGLELKEMISEVRFLCREEELLRIRSRFHDILGQRLALLFRSLREGEEPDEELIRRFAYDLPEELIAQTPLEKRDESRLMCLDKETGELSHHHFYELPDFLNPGDCLILNNSRVLPARLLGQRLPGGGACEVLLLIDRGDKTWECIVRPGKHLRKGAKMRFGNGELKAEVVDVLPDGNRMVKFDFEGIFLEVLEHLGKMPLPPYIKEELQDQERYQTVYSKVNGSAAAPTAGLHFTPELLEKIQAKGVNIGYVTLHVGLGTFRPVKEDDIEQHDMHSEYCVIPPETATLINETKARGGRVICVGTTSCRTLESWAQEDGHMEPSAGWTSIYIYPGYRFKVMDALVTNFHLPQSTLIMLVSALAGREHVLHAYEEAVKERYRFFSFGDAMFVS